MLPAPHGGTLVDRRLSPPAVQEMAAELPRLPRLGGTREQAHDIVNFATGGFSPLPGVIGGGEGGSGGNAVLRPGRRPGGLPWRIPIVLDAEAEAARRLGEGVLLPSHALAHEP